MMSKPLNVYLSFSKECTKLNKTSILDVLNNFDNVVGNAFMGGTYHKDIIDSNDVLLVVPPSLPDNPNSCKNSITSRGVHTEVVYAKDNLHIPVYAFLHSNYLVPVIHTQVIDRDKYKSGFGRFTYGTNAYALKRCLNICYQVKYGDKADVGNEYNVNSSKSLISAAPMLKLI